jgi:hypothetical protein
MALICNAFADNTVGSTQNASACAAPHLANLSDHQLLDEQFMLLVLDSLARLLPGVWAQMLSAPKCDLADALRNASCAMLTNTPQFPTTPTELQAQILYMLNEGVCGM